MVRYAKVETIQRARGYSNHWDLSRAGFDEGGTLHIPSSEKFRGTDDIVYVVPQSLWNRINFPDRERINQLWDEYQNQLWDEYQEGNEDQGEGEDQEG